MDYYGIKYITETKKEYAKYQENEIFKIMKLENQDESYCKISVNNKNEVIRELKISGDNTKNVNDNSSQNN